MTRGKIESTPRTITGGPEDFYLDKATYEIDGQGIGDGDEVEVDPMKSQKLEVSWKIGNRHPGWAPLWDGRVTVYDLTNGKKVDTERKTGDLTIGYGSPTLLLGTISKPTTFRINLMANQDHKAPEPALSLWKVRV